MIAGTTSTSEHPCEKASENGKVAQDAHLLEEGTENLSENADVPQKTHLH